MKRKTPYNSRTPRSTSLFGDEIPTLVSPYPPVWFHDGYRDVDFYIEFTLP